MQPYLQKQRRFRQETHSFGISKSLLSHHMIVTCIVANLTRKISRTGCHTHNLHKSHPLMYQRSVTFCACNIWGVAYNNRISGTMCSEQLNLRDKSLREKEFRDNRRVEGHPGPFRDNSKKSRSVTDVPGVSRMLATICIWK